MLNTQKLVKVWMAWTSIVYVVCYFGVMLFGGVRPGFMRYAFHMNYFGEYQNVLTFGTFVSGLVIWNVIAVLAVWLFAALWNRIK